MRKVGSLHCLCGRFGGQIILYVRSLGQTHESSRRATGIQWGLRSIRRVSRLVSGVGGTCSRVAWWVVFVVGVVNGGRFEGESPSYIRWIGNEHHGFLLSILFSFHSRFRFSTARFDQRLATVRVSMDLPPPVCDIDYPSVGRRGLLFFRSRFHNSQFPPLMLVCLCFLLFFAYMTAHTVVIPAILYFLDSLRSYPPAPPTARCSA